MTPRTSSGSWSAGRGAGAGARAGTDAAAGAGAAAGGRAGDIIDLDRYMRGTRPARAPPRSDNLNSLLVVDGGLPGRKPAPARSVPSSLSSGSASGSHGGGGGGGAGGGGGRGKRFSHDSGLSDTSYAHRPHAQRPHRCVGGTQMSAPAGGGGGGGHAPASSSASLRAFRASLERALRDQQAQIARVAQLCERQAAGRRAERRTERRAEHRTERRTPRKTPTDSTELSSSSRSSRDPRHADKHRSSECKTYKIIMSKLDELNRLFAARGGRPASPPSAAAAAPAPPAPGDSSGSVTVSDKLVATDFPHQGGGGGGGGGGRRASSRRLVERGAGGESRAEAGAGAGAGRGGARVIACAHSIDIPPRSNVPTESFGAARGGGSSSSSSDSGGSGGSALRGSFDLDDPVHLYAQAKRLQAMHATTRRARSAACAAHERSALDSALGSELGSARGAREPSLCALCRGYWRLARRCLTAPLAGMWL